MKILVAGAGIVGVSSAIWLQRAGHTVTLVDRGIAPDRASYGNAGILAASAVTPVTTPGLWKSAPALLLDRDAPLFLRWRYLPRLMPFLSQYLRYSTDRHVDHYAKQMGALIHDSFDQHCALAEGTPAAQFVSDADYCVGYERRADFDAAHYEWDKKTQSGVGFTVMTGAEYALEDPFFGDGFETVVRYENCGRVSDPVAYLDALIAHFESEGGTFNRAEITDIDVTDGDIHAIQTSQGRLTADRIVFALGAWSGKVADALGLKVPFETERGYHIELVNPSHMPKASMMVDAGAFVLTPMQGRLRAAGVLEFGGLEAGQSKAPLAMLKRQVARLLPDVTYERMDEWMGHRPATANSLPLIGAARPGGTSFLAFGHQHLGLTAGPKTGRIIAQMIAQQPVNMDVSAFDPAEYR